MLTTNLKQESRAIAGRTAQTAVNFDTYQILQRHHAVSLPGLCSWSLSADAVNHLSQVTSTKKNQTSVDRIFNADKHITWSLSITTVIIIYHQGNGIVINRTRKDRCEKARVLLPLLRTQAWSYRLRHSLAPTHVQLSQSVSKAWNLTSTGYPEFNVN